MSQQDVDIVQAAFRAFARGDTESVLYLCDENIEITQPPELPGVPRHQHGHSGVLQAFAVWPEHWDDYRTDILRVADLGDHVMVTAIQSGRGRDSGVQVKMQFTYLFAVRAGKIAEWRIFVREEQALRAVELEG